MMGAIPQLNQPKISNPQSSQPLLNQNIPTNPVGNKAIPEVGNLKAEKTSSGKKSSTPFIVENPLYSQSNPNNPLPNPNVGGPGGSTYAAGVNIPNVANPTASQQNPTSIQKTKSSGNPNPALLASPAATTTQKGAPTDANNALNTSQSSKFFEKDCNMERIFV